MIRYLSKLIFRIRMARFPKLPDRMRGPDGKFISKRDYRTQQMRGV